MEKEQFAPVETLSYNALVAELEGLVRRMQSDNCDIDLLTAYTRRAAELLRECRKRLTATEEEMRSILAEIEG